MINKHWLAHVVLACAFCSKIVKETVCKSSPVNTGLGADKPLRNSDFSEEL